MDLNTQKNQGEFNSHPIIFQLGTGSRAGPSNPDYQPMYCSDKVLNPYRVGLDLNNQEDQRELNSCPIISQPGAGSRTGPINTD